MTEAWKTTSAGESLDLLQDLIGKARAAGADAADAVLVESESLGVSYRLGALEDVARSESRDLGLRVLIGRKQAMASSTDFSAGALEQLVERAVAMARAAPEDPYCGLIEPDLLSKGPFPDLDTFDATPFPDADALRERAAEAEDAARAVKGVTNSEGAGADWGVSGVALATSGGFAGTYRGSRHAVSVSVIAGEGTAMERDYDFSSARHFGDVESPAEVGRRAGEKTVARLKPRKAKTAKLPVVFDPRVSGGLLGHFAGAIVGAAIARRSSFLKDKLDKAVFRPDIQIIDDPLRKRGLRSKPFDGEGVATRRQALVKDGVLQTWLLNAASARQLGLKPTGHASRGVGGPPGSGATNLYLAPGKLSVAELIADIEAGIYVTELIGMGVNGVTGDYSRGATGFWIEKGEIAYPVNEFTLAGNLIDMFQSLTPADDLAFRYGVDAPTVRIDGMTIASG